MNKLRLIALTLLLIIFQGCDSPQSGTLSMQEGSFNSFSGECDNYDCSVAIEKSNKFCFLDGEPVADGQRIEAFIDSQSSNCQSEQRICQNGQLSGAYSSTYCIDHALIKNGQRPCLFNNQLVDHGKSVTAFLNGAPHASGSCQKEVRTCTNGHLSGSFQYESCSEQATCLFNGRTYKESEYVVAYRYGADLECEKEFRLCKNGFMTGSFPMAGCMPGGKTCYFDNKTFIEGESILAFGNYSKVLRSCPQEVRRCEGNRALSGSLPGTSCTPPKEKNVCYFANEKKENGEIFIAYKKAEDANGIHCLHTRRTCLDGEISGDESYSLNQCDPRPFKSCIFTSKSMIETIVHHGEAIKTYSVQEGDEFSSCESVSSVSECFDGAFNASTNNYHTCRPFRPQGKSCQLLGKTLEDGDFDNLYANQVIDLRVVPDSTCNDANNSLTIYCNNGLLLDESGNTVSQEVLDTHPNLSCQEKGATCSYLGSKISHGTVFSLFKKNQVKFSEQESCDGSSNSIYGECYNGSLVDRLTKVAVNTDGYTFPYCVVVGDSCSFEGTTYKHNDVLNKSYFKSNIVDFIQMNDEGYDFSCFLNNNMSASRCIDGKVMELTKRDEDNDGVSEWVPMDFNLYKYDKCTVQGQPCHAYGTTYPHGKKLGYRYRASNIKYVDESTSCSSRANRIALVCANGQLNEYQVAGDNSGSFVSRTHVSESDFPFQSCEVDE